jgi:RNA polymerase sigma-70 factor (ECF subfamily)
VSPSGSDPPTNEQPRLDQWIEETLPRALGYAMSLVPQRCDAEDLVHDCYMRLLAKSDVYDLPNDGAKLLFRSITHACINWQQRRPPVVALDAHTESLVSMSSPASPEQLAMHGELEVAVGEALSRLPVVQRAAVELRGLGHSLTEMAEILEISHANARVTLHRARQALSERLARFLNAEGADS